MEPINPIVTQWCKKALEDPQQFWSEAATELHWFRKWDHIYQDNPPTFKWFSGGLTNLSYNCIDHHVNNGKGGHAAIAYANERGGREILTYSSLLHRVKETSAALRGMGITKGDRITIYMPVCPEALILMLATVRIGAIHSVIFAGFGAGAIADRVNASGSKLIFTTDITYRKGKDINLKEIVDSAIQLGLDSVEHVIILPRSGETINHENGRYILWADFLKNGTDQDNHYELMEANEPAYILATSGTTAKPKLVVHVHGGYQVNIFSMGRWCFNIKPDDVWWAMSDIGWVVGHSYILYAPLLLGSTTIAYEGAIDHPEPDAVWKLIEEFGVTGLFTSPTAVRLLMRYGEDLAEKYEVPSLDRVFCAGEVLNVPAWEWLQKTVLKGRVPVMDHWWQTETGGPVVGNPYGLSILPIKPGSAGIALPGIDLAVMTPDGLPCPVGEKGILVIKSPFPSLTPALWGEDERYKNDYWRRIPGVYFTGDAAHIDEDGYVWFAGRADEVIKIAAHRLGTIEVETAFMKHQAVAEAGVTGRPDEVRGEVISAFVVLKDNYRQSHNLKRELIQTVRRELGPVAVIGDLNFVNMIPKTRSGKIMRRVFKSVVLDQDPGDITTIEDEGSVDEARQAWKKMKEDLNN